MGSIIDLAASIISRAERQVEVAGQNISNANTTAYKRRVSFEALLTNSKVDINSEGEKFTEKIIADFSPGKLVETGRPYDLAIAGKGFFAVASDGQQLYSRQGRFDRDADGRLVNGQGQALQVEGGGDLRLKSDNFKILNDGSVIEGGSPVAQLAVVDFDPAAATPVDGGAYSVAAASVASVEQPSVYQGRYEASNVMIGAEMVSIMGALRRAETGQRLVMVYDDLMGRALQSLGQST